MSDWWTAVDNCAGEGYAPVSWPDVQAVRQLQQGAGTSGQAPVGMRPPSFKEMSHDLRDPAGRPGHTSSAQEVPEGTVPDGPDLPHVRSTRQNSAAFDLPIRQSQRDFMVADGFFLPVAPRDMLVHPPQADGALRWHPQAAIWKSPEEVDPDPAVLHSLGKAWLHRSKLRGMVRQLKGAGGTRIPPEVLPMIDS